MSTWVNIRWKTHPFKQLRIALHLNGALALRVSLRVVVLALELSIRYLEAVGLLRSPLGNALPLIVVLRFSRRLDYRGLLPGRRSGPASKLASLRRP